MTRFLSCYGPRKGRRREKRRRGQRAGEGERQCCAVLRECAALKTKGRKEREEVSLPRRGVYNWLPRVISYPTSQLCVSRTIARRTVMFHAAYNDTRYTHQHHPRSSPSVASALYGIPLYLEIIRRLKGGCEARHAARHKRRPKCLLKTDRR